ncbi:hypothetical protein AJ78_07239 [Emergomyces pasteurianus Ep9510]|uniref:Uncharacterized protein n=1 Tax=Emergomyces pasteurianus Ep9510 TaxID=1447872 RepID=A0A1J9P7N9_9EURO|nr:hypothetical protein AJ78_07239 [Emergomyces pasteurianus Ep9510]
MPQSWIVKRLRSDSPSGQSSSGMKKGHNPMSRLYVLLRDAYCSSFRLSNESFYYACKACGQQPTQPVGGSVSSSQFADSSHRFRVTCTREFSVVQSMDFSGGTYVSGRTIFITSKNGISFSQTIFSPSNVQARGETWNLCLGWSRPFEGKGEERKPSELRRNIAHGTQPDIEAENWRKNHLSVPIPRPPFSYFIGEY